MAQMRSSKGFLAPLPLGRQSSLNMAGGDQQHLDKVITID